MKLVLDSCVAVKWFLAEPDSATAVRILDESHRQLQELLAPDVFPIEVAHALSRAERRGLIVPPDGARCLSDLFALLPALHTSLVLLPRAVAVHTPKADVQCTSSIRGPRKNRRIEPSYDHNTERLIRFAVDAGATPPTGACMSCSGSQIVSRRKPGKFGKTTPVSVQYTSAFGV